MDGPRLLCALICLLLCMCRHIHINRDMYICIHIYIHRCLGMHIHNRFFTCSCFVPSLELFFLPGLQKSSCQVCVGSLKSRSTAHHPHAQHIEQIVKLAFLLWGGYLTELFYSLMVWVDDMLPNKPHQQLLFLGAAGRILKYDLSFLDPTLYCAK